jgi:hypothetical protein
VQWNGSKSRSIGSDNKLEDSSLPVLLYNLVDIEETGDI